ncbi:MAG: hypothetical protein EP338_02420 [Bacteroidetes bacterium]|nr:MAG: hypothetical protein EP338_02420 [Bacteroidota bacterium]
MTKLHHYISILILGLSLIACNKEIPTLPSSNNSVFQVTGMIGSDSVSWTAGVDGTMKPEIRQVNGVPYYSGKLKMAGQEFEIGFFSGNLDRNIPLLNMISELDELKYVKKNLEPLLKVSKNTFEGIEDLEQIDWYINGEFFAKNLLEIFEPGVYDVCGEFLFKDGELQRVCNRMIIGYKKDKIFNLQRLIIPNTELYLWVDGMTESIDFVNWKRNGDSIGTGTNVSLTPAKGFNEIEARIKYINGTERTRKIAVHNEYPGRYILDFGILENYSPYAQDHKARVVFKSGNSIYSSELADNEQNRIYFDDISYYSQNVSGENLYKIKGRLNGQLRSKTSNETLKVDLAFDWAFPIH